MAKQWDNTKPIFRNQRHLCTPTTKYQKQKLGKSPIYCTNKKNKVPSNKPSQGGKTPVLRILYNTEERNQGRHKQMETYTMFMDRNN